MELSAAVSTSVDASKARSMQLLQRQQVCLAAVNIAMGRFAC